MTILFPFGHAAIQKKKDYLGLFCVRGDNKLSKYEFINYLQWFSFFPSVSYGICVQSNLVCFQF